MPAPQESLNIKIVKFTGNLFTQKNILIRARVLIYPKILNENGSFFQFGLILTLAFFGLSFFLLFKNLETLRLVRERKENYLCFKALLKEANSFTKTLARTNTIIAVNFPLQFNPYTGPFHKEVIQVTKLIQETQSVHYRAKIMKLNSCSLVNRVNFLRLQFHKTSVLGMGFSRSPIETTIPIPNENWVYLWSSKRNLFVNTGDIIAVSTKNPNALSSPIFEIELKNIGTFL